MTLRGIVAAAVAVLALCLGGCDGIVSGPSDCESACKPRPVAIRGYAAGGPLCICGPLSDGGR